MKKLLTLCLGVLSFSGFAQTTYNIADFGTAGYAFLESKSTTSLGLHNFSLTGTNYTWDYSLLTVDKSYERQVLDPNNTQYKAPYLAECIANTGNPITCNTNWNNLTDIARVEFDSIPTGILTVYDVTSLMSYSGGYLVANIQGAEIKDTSNTKVPVTSEFTDKDTVFVFPMNYNDVHSSHGLWDVDLTPLGYNAQLYIDYDRNYTVEGWGSLITPYKFHNDVLKVRTQIDEVDSLVYNGFPAGSINRTIVQYTWFDPNYGMPVLQASGQMSGSTETIEEVTFMDSTFVGIVDDNLTQLNVYPNPTSDFIKVSFNETVPFTHAVVIDVTGKEYLRTKVLTNINVSQLAEGTYFVGVFNDKKPVGFRKFTKN